MSNLNNNQKSNYLPLDNDLVIYFYIDILKTTL